jgi:Mg-chelatase subunit ChlD
VFVIDISGSMQGPRIVAAKRELSLAVEALPADVSFSIIAFHTRAIVWQGKLVPASPEYKRNAQYFIAGLTLGNKTASYDALAAALEFDAEAIYFLTDGAPTAGKITSPPQIVTAVSQQNRYRRLTINALGIGVDSPLFEDFLATLAQQNFGRFERVDR